MRRKRAMIKDKKAYFKDLGDISDDFAMGRNPTNLKVTLASNVVYLGQEEKSVSDLYGELLYTLGLPQGGKYTASMFDPNMFSMIYTDENLSPLMDLAINLYQQGAIAYGAKKGDQITYNLSQLSYTAGDFELETLDGRSFITLDFEEIVRKTNPWQLSQNAIQMKRKYKYFLEKTKNWQVLDGMPENISYEEFCRKVDNGEIDLTLLD